MSTIGAKVQCMPEADASTAAALAVSYIRFKSHEHDSAKGVGNIVL